MEYFLKHKKFQSKQLELLSCIFITYLKQQESAVVFTIKTVKIIRNKHTSKVSNTQASYLSFATIVAQIMLPTSEDPLNTNQMLHKGVFTLHPLVPTRIS